MKILYLYIYNLISNRIHDIMHLNREIYSFVSSVLAALLESLYLVRKKYIIY